MYVLPPALPDPHVGAPAPALPIAIVYVVPIVKVVLEVNSPPAPPPAPPKAPPPPPPATNRYCAVYGAAAVGVLPDILPAGPIPSATCPVIVTPMIYFPIIV
jgi:hypothetical protein